MSRTIDFGFLFFFLEKSIFKWIQVARIKHQNKAWKRNLTEMRNCYFQTSYCAWLLGFSIPVFDSDILFFCFAFNCRFTHHLTKFFFSLKILISLNFIAIESLVGIRHFSINVDLIFSYSYYCFVYIYCLNRMPNSIWEYTKL